VVREPVDGSTLYFQESDVDSFECIWAGVRVTVAVSPSPAPAPARPLASKATHLSHII